MRDLLLTFLEAAYQDRHLTAEELTTALQSMDQSLPGLSLLKSETPALRTLLPFKRLSNCPQVVPSDSSSTVRSATTTPMEFS